MLRLKLGLTVTLLCLALGAAGCSLYRNDRCYVPPQQYKIARDLFIRTGSLDLVRQQLEDYEWRTCRINETLYRLGKEFEVLPEELPAAPAQPADSAAPAPAKS